MTRLIAVLAHLPAVRRAFLTVLFLAGLGDMVAAIVLLAYQLTMTVSLFPSRNADYCITTAELTCSASSLFPDRLPARRSFDRHHLLFLHRVPHLVLVLEAVLDPPARLERK